MNGNLEEHTVAGRQSTFSQCVLEKAVCYIFIRLRSLATAVTDIPHSIIERAVDVLAHKVSTRGSLKNPLVA